MKTKNKTASTNVDNTENNETSTQPIPFVPQNELSGEIHNIPLKDIEVVEGFNLRQKLTDIKELAASIEGIGQRDPVKVYKNEKGKTVLVQGHRRFKAMQEIGAKTIKAIYLENVNPQNLTLEQLVGNDGVALNPVEQAEGVRQLSEAGWKPKDISAYIGKTQAMVSNLLLLAQAPKKVKSAVVKGEISATMATSMGRECRKDDDTINEEKWSSKVEKAVDKAKSQGKPKATNKTEKSGEASENKQDNRPMSMTRLISGIKDALKENNIEQCHGVLNRLLQETGEKNEEVQSQNNEVKTPELVEA